MVSRVCLVCVCLCALAVSMASAKHVPQNTQLRDIAVVKDIRDFVKNHPGLKLVRMYKDSSKTRNQSVRYTLGGRVSGDRLVAQAGDVFAYPAKKNVAIQMTYPESGTGSIVTYVEIACTQDNNDGNAYVVAGGIGQRFLSVIVEATQTETFSYTAQYYGSD